MIESFSQQEFLEDIWDYQTGDHITILSRTGGGKTTFIFKLLEHIPEQKNPPLMLIMKPRDETVKEGIKKLQYKKIKTYPPVKSLSEYVYKEKPKGYALWPDHSFETYADNDAHYAIFRKAILGAYKKGDTIIIADETFSLEHELGLTNDLETIWSKGRSMGTGLTAATQRPFNISQYAYNSPEHLFLSYDPDERNVKRFSEIGGVDPKLVREEVMKLEKYEWLYIRRTGPAMCIIEAN